MSKKIKMAGRGYLPCKCIICGNGDLVKRSNVVRESKYIGKSINKNQVFKIIYRCKECGEEYVQVVEMAKGQTEMFNPVAWWVRPSAKTVSLFEKQREFKGDRNI